MRTHSVVRMLACAVVVTGCSSALAAQPPALAAPMAAPPQIIASAREQVEISPDRAMLSLAVQTTAKTAAAAGRENARIQTAVLDTLKKMGIESEQIRTQGVSVSPQYEYPRDGGRPTIVGYEASNAVQIELRDLTKVGTTIDGGLGAGATRVGGLRFFASNTDEARREAMRLAVESVRMDAEAVARAAGGQLGSLIEILVHPADDGRQGYDVMPMALMKSAQAEATTPIEAGLITVSVSLTAKFHYISR
ncbi:MAG TPA: SIMPL domain-containing protein [Gemmatimonadaceae bacterium]|nr:SIMPL domain-containing protein [Gemmatimonadaceae bacterium]